MVRRTLWDMTAEPWWQNNPAIIAMREAVEADVARWNDEIAADDREPYRPGNDPIIADLWDGTARRELRTAADDLDRARARYDAAVLGARTAGMSWGEIGALLGVARQQLHRRYRDTSTST